jgi:hypothetical protein
MGPNPIPASLLKSKNHGLHPKHMGPNPTPEFNPKLGAELPCLDNYWQLGYLQYPQVPICESPRSLLVV